MLIVLTPLWFWEEDMQLRPNMIWQSVASIVNPIYTYTTAYPFEWRYDLDTAASPQP